jgi:hypothetical protein
MGHNSHLACKPVTHRSWIWARGRPPSRRDWIPWRFTKTSGQVWLTLMLPLWSLLGDEADRSSDRSQAGQYHP